MKLQATYKTEIITDSSIVKSEKCNAIIFENIGLDDATINNDIPLAVSCYAREFITDSQFEITNDFIIKFAGNSANKKVLVIKRLYQDEPRNGTNQSTQSGRPDRCCK